MTTIKLHSSEHRDLLDVIDKLRSERLGTYVNLPQILVCGDQSSGKSSVLEAISGLKFQVKDGLSTHFATELILRKDSEVDLRVSINPGSDRSADEAARLKQFGATFKGEDFQLDDIVMQAQSAIGLPNFSSNGLQRNGTFNIPEETLARADAALKKEFTSDVLRVELQRPDQLHLTLVDLPGLYKAGNKEQSIKGARIVEQLVQYYMTLPRSIIVTVVAANNEFALQEVTELARSIDTKGDRTLGVDHEARHAGRRLSEREQLPCIGPKRRCALSPRMARPYEPQVCHA
jgi:GTPase SAR1 family protein